MTTPEEEQIRKYLHQLLDLALEKKEIEKKSSLLEKAVRALIDLVPGENEQLGLLEALDEIVRPAGLTNAVRSALHTAAGTPLTPREVRDIVPMFLVGHSNPLASVHTVLKRLSRTDDVEATTKEGNVAYRWVDRRRNRLARAFASVNVKSKPAG
jgi:hypothetical protein